MKKWRCMICGYVHTGEEPPESCPSCGAPKEAFELITKGPNPVKKPDADLSVSGSQLQTD